MARGGMRAMVVGVCAVLLGMAAPAFAQDRIPAPPAVEPTLRPGEFIWYDDPALTPASYEAQAPVSIIVSLAAQRAYIYRDSTLIGVSTVSTGKPGKETPLGDFTVLQKQIFHRSNKYSGAPMPFMQRLTWDGVALHAGHLPGYPASHGCIRLPAAFAKQLYELTEVGAAVSVVEDPIDATYPSPITAPLLRADVASLGGDSFNIVTVSATRDEAIRRPASWVTGPATEIVQPIPANTH